MSAKEVWSKYRLALPVFLCLAVAGFIIAMLLRAGRSAEPPMYAVDSSDSRSRPSSQTATRSSTGSRPPTVASETTGEKPKDETAKPVTRSSRTAKTTTLRTSRTTTAKSTKSTSAKTTRSTADRSELYQKKLEELQKELLRLANSKKDYNSVADEIDRLRELKQKVLTESAEREGLKKRIAEMREFLEQQPTEVLEYDEQLVRRLIEKVTVYEERFEVEFKSGAKVDIER